jgi:hypothetical protein
MRRQKTVNCVLSSTARILSALNLLAKVTLTCYRPSKLFQICHVLCTYVHNGSVLQSGQETQTYSYFTARPTSSLASITASLPHRNLRRIAISWNGLVFSPSCEHSTPSVRFPLQTPAPSVPATQLVCAPRNVRAARNCTLHATRSLSSFHKTSGSGHSITVKLCYSLSAVK